jgi:branched-subunit amino acid ABC-type transport system permease component
MHAVPRVAAAATLACSLAGCIGGIDAGQARICRSVIPALNPSGVAFDIVRIVALASGEGVRVDYRARVPDGPSRSHFLECRFSPGSRASPDRGALIGVTTESGRLGELRLQLLQRFWLEAEGAAADPEPVPGASLSPEVPRAVAVSLQHVLFALPPVAIYALLAAAYSLVYGLVGRLNLAFGELAAVSGYAAFLAFAIAGRGSGVAVSLLLALLLALSAALAYGVASGRLVFAPLMRQSGQRVLIGTMAIALVLQEGLRLAQGSRLKWVEPMLNAPYAVARAGNFVATVTPMALLAAALCLGSAMALLALMRWSRFGRAWRACADDALAAELFGIDRGRVLLSTFALASVLAGLAGYVMTVYYGTVGYAGGIVLGLKALLAAVAGGIGSVPGAFLGGLLLGCAEAGWSALLPIEFRDLAIFTGLVVLLVVRPSGLFGFAEPLPRRP